MLRLFTAIYCIAITLALLNYGAVDLLSVTLLAVPVFLLLAVSAICIGVPGHSSAAMLAATLIPTFAFAWIFLQTSAWPVAGDPAWRAVQSYVSGVTSVVSLTPADDWASAIRIAVPFGIFMLGLILFVTDERATAALKVLAVVGGVVSLLSILQFQFAPKTLLFGAKSAYFDSLSGFFINRNTAATYFGLMALMSYALCGRATGGIEIRRLLTAIDRRRPLAPDQGRQLWGAAGYGLLFLLTVIALVLTKSRAGIVSSFAALVLLTLFICLRPANRRTSKNVFAKTRLSKVRRVGVAILLSAALSIVFLLLAGRALKRADGTFGARGCTLPGIFSGAQDHLPWGSGLASFEAVFAAYKDPSCGITGIWNRAHNFYLEGLFTFGAMFPVLALGTFFLLFAIFKKGMATRRRLRYAPEIGFASLLLIAFHSAFDFSLQISGIAVIYAVMLAPIVSICLNLPGRTRVKRRRRRHGFPEGKRDTETIELA